MIDGILQFLLDNPYLTIFGATCIIQIAPIQVNPWSSLIKWMGKILTSGIEEKVEQLEKKVDAITVDIAQERVQRVRWNILDFTDACRQGHLHTKEEWNHCIDELKWYEDYCEVNKISNGVIEQSSQWLKAKYNEHLDNDDFMKE